MGEGDEQSRSDTLNIKTLHLILLAVWSVTIALLGAIGGLIAWGVIVSNNCLVHEISKDLPATAAPASTLKTAPSLISVQESSPLDAVAAPPVLANLDWWQHCVVYEVYPLSFKDSDGDGIGDLEGIISHLSHFKDAGVDAIVLNPSEIFESTMIDFGFDVVNVYDINPILGDMEDFENLLNTAHDMGIKVLVDFVPEYVSIQSEYFKKSEAGDPEYKDIFVWADGIPDPKNPTKMLAPSNWESVFSGPAWEWNEKRKQYYLHQYDVSTADYNHRDPTVKQEMFNIMQFWLDKGVDGFWPGGFNFFIEADPADHEGRYPDNPEEAPSLYTTDQIELYDVVYEWRHFIDKYNEKHGGDTRVFFSYAYTNITMTMLYYGNKTGALGSHIPFNFDLVLLPPKSNARDFVYTIMKWLSYMPHGGVANWQLGNHDFNRMPNRFRFDMVDGLNSLIMMLPGTSFTYQGEEIGMRDGYVSWEETLDVNAKRRGNASTYYIHTRDPGRTPFHWNDSINAGFSSGESTWLPVAEDYMEINLAKQKSDERSHFKVYQALTALREEKTLSHGDYDIRALTDSSFYVVRSLRTYDTLVFLFNVGEDPDTIVLGRVPYLKTPATVYISSIHSSRVAGDIIDGDRLTLVPGEALILRAPPV